MKKILLATLISATLFSCKKDEKDASGNNSSSGDYRDIKITQNDYPQEKTYAELDAQTVTDNLKISGSTKTTGAPPSPSTDPNAPSLYESGSVEPLYGVQSKNLEHYLGIESGSNIAGIYMKLPGANEYFTIPVQKGSEDKSKATSIRSKKASKKSARPTRSSNNYYFEIELPSNLSGEFCYNYCVFDSAGLVSNVVSQCVVIESLGGNLPFNTPNWNMVAYGESYDEDGDEIDWTGTGEKYTITDSITSCYDTINNSYQNIFEVYTEEYIMLDGELTLNNDGTYNITIDDWSKTIENDSYYCQSNYDLVESTDTYEENGYWNYDENSETLTLIDQDNYLYRAKVIYENARLILNYEDWIEVYSKQ